MNQYEIPQQTIGKQTAQDQSSVLLIQVSIHIMHTKKRIHRNSQIVDKLWS